MATFIISYDAHNVRDYDTLYEEFADVGAVRLLESVWGTDLDNTAAEVRDWIRGLLDDDDSVLVIQVKPKPSWATRLVTKEASAWLNASL